MGSLTALRDAPRFVFFTGKGGVGKTSLACASAVALADAGRRVLLASTDPASNVGQVFGQEIGLSLTGVLGVPGLSAIEIDPDASAQAYREQILGPVRGLLPEAIVAGIEEQLSGGCTTEIAAFDQFTSLLTDPGLAEAFDHVVFDTAPTGHTLRMLRLPAAWSGFIATASESASTVGPLAGLRKSRAKYAAAVQALADPTKTRMVLVARAQPTALTEAARTSVELVELGVTEQRLVVNGVMPAAEGRFDPLARAVYVREEAALNGQPPRLADLARDIVALRPGNVMGTDQLRGLLEPTTPPPAPSVAATSVVMDSLDGLIDELARDGAGLIMTMGKGGVGKTTAAAAIAVALAERGHRVHLTTSDPADHLAATLGSTPASLTLSRIDPVAERERYKAHVLAVRSGSLDGEGMRVLREDLESPCTEEIAVLQAFASILLEADNQFVVMDTAPTGHTLLLLDAAGAYHREALRQLGTSDAALDATLGRLQDPERTKVLIVTLPEATPVLEAEALQRDLGRAGITPWAWIANQSLNGVPTSSTLLMTRAQGEVEHLLRVRDDLSVRSALVPLLAREPSGEDLLAVLAPMGAPEALAEPVA